MYSDGDEFDVDSLDMTHVSDEHCSTVTTQQLSLSVSSSTLTDRSASGDDADIDETPSLLSDSDSRRLSCRHAASSVLMMPDELAQGDVVEVQQLAYIAQDMPAQSESSQQLTVNTTTTERVEERLRCHQQPSLINGNYSAIAILQ